GAAAEGGRTRVGGGQHAGGAAPRRGRARRPAPHHTVRRGGDQQPRWTAPKVCAHCRTLCSLLSVFCPLPSVLCLLSCPAVFVSARCCRCSVCWLPYSISLVC